MVVKQRDEYSMSNDTSTFGKRDKEEVTMGISTQV